MPEELDTSDFVESMAMIISRTANGPVLHRRAEAFLSPRPANLARTPDEVRALEGRVAALAVAAGGLPTELQVVPGEQKKRFDTYSNAALNEVLAVFYRARRSVIDAHLSFTGHLTLKEHPDWLTNPPTGEGAKALANAMEDQFWESTETAYIRLASFWDRVAQLLDFFFFGIRHFERDGFAAVVERIVLNLAPVDHALDASPALTRLRSYQVSEQESGYAWLARRRNLLVHSLHLQPIAGQPEQDLFDTLHNHLEARLQKKLKPGTPVQEVERLHAQLTVACERFEDVLSLCELRSAATRARLDA